MCRGRGFGTEKGWKMTIFDFAAEKGWKITIFKDFCDVLPQLTKKLQRRGIPGVFLDLEPHLKGGGQFGGFSGPDGLGVALRSLCRILDLVGVKYRLRDFADVRAMLGR